MFIAWSGKHYGEEPPISGTRGSGTIFFSGCNLHCIFCQNYQISQLGIGQNTYTPEQLAVLMLGLQKESVHNINLVSPTIWSKEIIEGLKIARKKGLIIPVVYNTNAYDNVEVLRQFNGLIDIYLPDFKYADDKVALKLSGIPNYPYTATLAIREMLGQVGNLILDSESIAIKGVLVRHLILPGYIENSLESIRIIRNFSSNIHLSLMTQYNPAYLATGNKELGRTLSLEEAEIVIAEMNKLKFVNGWYQPIGERAAVYLNPDFTKKNPFN
ncbi:MAG: radical SAM protein [Candidatus Parcubacteria bacterium]|nr:radical SAM protein [Candidatus Parcubacteria bacterium]